MASRTLSILFRDSESAVEYDIDQVPCFKTFVKRLRGDVHWLTGIPDEFTYELNIDQKCSLNGEPDYKNMIMLCRMLNRTVVYVGMSDKYSEGVPKSNEESMQQTEIPHFFRNTKPFRGAESSPVCKPKHVQKRKGTAVPPHVFEDPVYAAPGVDFPRGKQRADLSKRQRLQAREETGDWFSGAQTDIPRWDIAPEEEPVVLRSAKWGEYITHIGQEFYGGVIEFRSKLVKYSAKIGFQYAYKKNDATYIRAECKERESDGCMWFVKGSLDSITTAFVIRDAELRHTCKLSLQTMDTKRMGQRLVGGFITDAIRDVPTLTPSDLKRDILKYWGFNICYEKVWRSVEVARANVFGTYDDSFNELRWYSDGIQRTNPGSVVALETEPVHNRFKRFFLAFDASLKGFHYCRPMLFVDGTFMKTRYKGTLLSATAKDGNNGLFPVAIAIVANENADNWTWFIEMINKHVKHEKEIMFVSDRAGGLLHAFNNIPSKPLHFYCLYHLMKNLRAMYTGKSYSDVHKNHMCKLLKDAAYAPNINYYRTAIDRFVQKGGPQAVHFLEDLPPEKWAVAFAPGVHRYGELTSNAAESFNHWILDARTLPVTFMLDCIRQQLMRWFVERRIESQKITSALTPRMQESWNEMKEAGENWILLPTLKHGVVEVKSAASPVVDLHQRKCGCYQWQIRGFPCVHAVAVINYSRWDIKAVIDPCFLSNTYAMVYAADLNPIPKTEKYEFLDLNQPAKILPPIHRVVPGRPRKLRIRSVGESKKKQFLCGRCGKYGNHYWTTCGDALND